MTCAADILVRDILEMLTGRAAVLPPTAKGRGDQVVVMLSLSGAGLDWLAAAGAALEDLEPEPLEDDGLREDSVVEPWGDALWAVA